jgi:hypothetical protein
VRLGMFAPTLMAMMELLAGLICSGLSKAG